VRFIDFTYELTHSFTVREKFFREVIDLRENFLLRTTERPMMFFIGLLYHILSYRGAEGLRFQ
jgi:hypothetical protein